MTTVPKPRFRFSLRTLFVVVVGIAVAMLLSIPVGQGIRTYKAQHDRYVEKLMREAYMLDGTVDIESERGKGLFTDQELDSIKLRYEKLKSAR